MVRSMTRLSGNLAAAAAATDGTPQSTTTVQASAEVTGADSRASNSTGDAAPQVTVIVKTSADDSADVSSTRTVMLAGEAMRRISEAAWAAQASEQAVLASKDPLQDNPEAEQFEQVLQSELDKEPRAEPAPAPATGQSGQQ